MKKATGTEKNIIIIDPRQPDAVDDKIQMLFEENTNAIEDPKDYFHMEVVEKDKNLLLLQAQQILDVHIRHLGIAHDEFDVIERKLEQLKFISYILEKTFLKEKLTEAYSLLSEHLEAQLVTSQNLLDTEKNGNVI